MTNGQHNVLGNASTAIARLKGLTARIESLREECERTIQSSMSDNADITFLFDELSLLVGMTSELFTLEITDENKRDYIRQGQSSRVS